MMQFFKRRPYQWALIGILLSFIGPLGEWVFIRVFPDYIADSLFLTYIYTELSALVAFSIFGFTLGLFAEKVEKLAVNDKLTGLFNRHYMIERFQQLLALQKRYRESLALIMFDLDYFKRVNDTFGHPVGDQTLKAVADCVRQYCRETDVLCRYGGEEFIILCPNSDAQVCYLLAERIRKAVEMLALEELGFPGPQTISLGVYELPVEQNLSMEQALKHLDEALYQAKKQGRNTVVINTNV